MPLGAAVLRRRGLCLALELSIMPDGTAPRNNWTLSCINETAGLPSRGSIVYRSHQTLHLIVFGIAGLPLAYSQAPETLVNPSTPAAVRAPVVAPDKMDLIDKVLGMVGPSDPTVLTERARFHLYVLSTAGPVPLLGEAAGSAINHWSNSPPEWGQGWGAYGERFGSNLAYNGVRQTISYGLSIPFHEDNRYFASGKHGIWSRTGYAILSTFTARHPDGRQSFSVSGVTGVIGASAIASIWGPGSWKGAHNIADNAGISFGVTAAFNVVREFLPDVLHRPRGDQAVGH